MDIIPNPKSIQINSASQIRRKYASSRADSFLASLINKDRTGTDFQDCEVVSSLGQEDLYYLALSTKPRVVLPAFPEELSGHDEGFYISVNKADTFVLSRSKRGLLYGWNFLNKVMRDQAVEEIEFSKELEEADKHEKVEEIKASKETEGLKQENKALEAIVVGQAKEGQKDSQNDSQKNGQNFFQLIVIDYPDSEFRAFHMDMRYGFPSLQRMLEIIDELVDYRFNTFVLEYENRFPFSKNPDVSDKEHYSPEDIRTILDYANQRYLDIIPLQQTIGHLEYMLKLPQYYHLREMREFPETEESFSTNSVGFKHFNNIDEICASNEEAYSIVEGLLGDIIEAHKDSEYIHIGCDEAWNLLSCEDCIENYGKAGKNRLYIKHINRMSDIVLKAGKKPLVWDDMLRSFDDEDLKLLHPDLGIMIWLYYESNYKLAKELVEKFRDKGFTVFGAAAAKCGEGPEPQYLDMPWYPLRMGNVDMWGRICEEEKIAGFCMTVWSNYSGVIAPPHPFFDTIWYPVLFSAEKLWNNNYPKADFDSRFVADFFGIQGMVRPLQGGGSVIRENLTYIEEKATRHRYEARAMNVMSLASLYRLKSLAIGRELYKLVSGEPEEAQKFIVRNRAEEVRKMAKDIKPLVHELVSTHYTEDNAREFVDSRFMADDVLYKQFGFE